MKFKISIEVVCIFAVVAYFSQVLMAYDIDCNHFEGSFDDAGYSDVINWGGNSTIHPYSMHEVLSGEWGCAINYDNISTEPKSMWLTTDFLYPYWTTNSTFSTSSYLDSWDDPNNPVVGNDTAQSKIISADGKIEITIDYEIVDLGAIGWSPLNITDANGNIGSVKSDRMLFLQTYTIENIQASGNITSLELYQLLHGHGANDYGSTIHASYTAANYNDPLTNYVPYNSVHSVGNFQFDFTQWNNLSDTNKSSWVTHTDWVGFSCIVEPDVYDCDFYVGGHSYGTYKPPAGTHIHIEERNLNNVNYAYGETAGAMGWYLPDLAPGESTSITVAFMFGYGPIDYNQPIPPIDVNLTLADNVSDCVNSSTTAANSYFNYNICYSAGEDIDDVNVVANLPSYVDYNSCTGGGTYNSSSHKIVWDLGDLDANDTGCFTVSVRVAKNAIQGGTLTNTVKMYSGDTRLKTARKNTTVCCVYDTVFVDASAADGGDGLSWDTAYNDLQTALTNVNAGLHGCADKIFVAAGTYYPTDINDSEYWNATFQLVDGVNIYGHFEGWEDFLC